MYMVAEQKMLCPIHSMNRYICYTKYFCLYLENIVFISLANTCMSPDSSQWGSLWLLEEPGCSSFAPGEPLGVCAQLPLQPPSLCHSERSSTQPSLTFALKISSGGRSCLSSKDWLENLCSSPPYPMSFSGGKQALCFDIGHTRKQQLNRWSGRCNSGSKMPPLGGSQALLSGSRTLHWSPLKNVKALLYRQWRGIVSSFVGIKRHPKTKE